MPSFLHMERHNVSAEKALKAEVHITPTQEIFRESLRKRNGAKRSELSRAGRGKFLLNNSRKIFLDTRYLWYEKTKIKK